MAAGALEGRLYAVGGECKTKYSHEGTLYLSSMEYYDPIQNSWTLVAEMKYPRSFTAVAVLNGENHIVTHTHAHTHTKEGILLGVEDCVVIGSIRCRVHNGFTRPFGVHIHWSEFHLGID